ncbi:MAG TPA: hypothetical protein VN889_06525 [Solirubrobacteraceae bacterium]|nr:hypothetical protein [Solirubrobacteraceae bacterium]
MKAGKARASAVAAVLLVAVGGVTAAQAAASTFKTGVYTGTTSQGEKLSLKLAKVSECGHGHGLCLFDVTQGYVTLTCPPGASTNDYIDPFDTPVPANGKIHYSSVRSDGAKITESFQVKANATITGTFTITNVPDSIEPETLTGTCSANVTYTLHRA